MSGIRADTTPKSVIIRLACRTWAGGAGGGLVVRETLSESSLRRGFTGVLNYEIAIWD